jgi:AbrB family looped-hinge helix DNA binding protein
MFVEVGKEGRVVLPKDIRERRGLEEKTRLIIRERMGEIILIPVKKYKEPADDLFGSIVLDVPVDDPKELARKHVHERGLLRLNP